jgi:hypothetical protein
MVMCLILRSLKFGNLTGHLAYDQLQPSSVNSSKTTKVLGFIFGSIVLAFICHPEYSKSDLANICWAFQMYLESVALWPQIRMFEMIEEGSLSGRGNQRRSSNWLKRNPWVIHFLIGSVVARVLLWGFWTVGSSQGQSAMGIGAFLLGLVSQVIQLGFLGAFIYRYSRAGCGRSAGGADSVELDAVDARSNAHPFGPSNNTLSTHRRRLT